MAPLRARLDRCVEQAVRATVDDGDFEPFNELRMVLEQLDEECDVFATCALPSATGERVLADSLRYLTACASCSAPGITARLFPDMLPFTKQVQLRRVLKNRRAFPDDASVLKVLYVAIQRAARRWTMPIREWPGALDRYTSIFPDRMRA